MGDNKIYNILLRSLRENKLYNYTSKLTEQNSIILINIIIIIDNEYCVLQIT